MVHDIIARRAGLRIARRSFGLVLVSALAVAGLSATAQAKYENHDFDGLVAEGYGSTGKSNGFWQIGENNGTKSQLFSDTYLNNADDHAVYNYWETWTNSGVCFQPTYTSCNAPYYFFDSDESAHQTVEGWDDHYNHMGLPASASYARAAIRVRIDVPWRGDPESGQHLTTGSDY